MSFGNPGIPGFDFARWLQEQVQAAGQRNQQSPVPPPPPTPAPPPAPTLAQMQMQAYGPRAQGAPAATPPPQGQPPVPGIVPPGPASAPPRFSPFLPQPPPGTIGVFPDFNQQVMQQAPNAQHTPAASSASMASPGAAMELMLGQRGLSPESNVGKLYMEQGKSLPELFRLMGQGNPNDFAGFSEGLMNAQFSTNGEARNIGQAARMAAEDSLTNPASPQYQRYKQITETSDRQGERGPWGFWHLVVKPALMANNASNLDQAAKEAQFGKLIREHEMQNVKAVQMGQPQLSFQEFLITVDYKPVDW